MATATTKGEMRTFLTPSLYRQVPLLRGRGWAVAVLATAALVIAAFTPAFAQAATVPLGSESEGYNPPRLVIDSIGVGYTSWADGSSGEALDTCRLAPHANRCEARQSFSFPGVGTSVDAGNSPVFTSGGQLAILDSRCCVLSNQKELLTSSDHGTTFSAPTAIDSDTASGMTGNVLDLPAGFMGAGSPEQLLTSGTDAVTGGGSIQATGLTPAASDPGWYTPQVASGSLSQSIGVSGSVLVAVYTNNTTPHYSTEWVRYQGGDPNSSSSWSAPTALSPAPSLDSNAQLASGSAGIFVARSIATPGDNEKLVVQRFTGSAWSNPVGITTQSAGERFGIAESPTGRVYVIWKATTGSLLYAVARNKAATRFGKSIRLATRGEVEYPQIAVNAEGAGWATWSDDHSPSHVSALAIIPAPKVTRSGSVSLKTPRECVAVGGSFPVSLTSGHAQIAGVRFRLAAKTVAAPSGRATLTLRSASKATVLAQFRLVIGHGHSRSQSIRAKLIPCP
jgi:hypothetical protein